MLGTYWALIKFAALLYGAICIYDKLKTLMKISTWYLHTVWHTTPEGVANSTELVVFKQSPSLCLESFKQVLNTHHLVSFPECTPHHFIQYLYLSYFQEAFPKAREY